MKSEPIPLNRRILIVDDTAAIHADFRKLLEAGPAMASELAAASAAFLGSTPRPEVSESFALTSAYQGEEALKLVEESASQGRPFALCFLDIRMPPGWDGIETAARLWAVDPELQVVLCTAYSDYSWEEIAGRLGHSDRLLILKKPFDRMEVLQMAKTLTEKWRLGCQWKRQRETLDRLVDERTEELRASEQRLNAFFTGATTGLVVLDRELKYLQLNDTLAAINGLAAEQHPGRRVAEVVPNLAPVLEPLLREVFRTGTPVLNRELSGETPSQPGVQRHWVMSFFLIPGKNGTPEAVGGMVVEITERKQLEAQLRQVQKMEAIGQLAGGVAHDFNNLLAVIRGNAELMSLQAPDRTVSEREFLDQIISAADRGANLTRQLLTFSRKQLMQPRSLDLNEMLGNLTKMLKRLISEDIELESRYAAQVPAVLADIGMLEQVVLNLVVNARDAMPQGGHLLLGTEAVVFSQAHDPAHPQARPEEFACLTVSDTGTGIAQEHLSRIFDPFFTTKAPGKGTGLGLATVYGIVQQHQGWVEVSSQLGTGSTFKVFLPSLQGVAKPVARASQEPAPQGGSETILVVEDDAAVRSLTRRILDGSGYRVREAASGQQALELWAREGAQVDLLLTDMIMPEGVSGPELARQLRSSRPDLKIIFMSGYSGDTVAKDASFLQENNCRFLQKPCSARALLHAVRQHLDSN